MKVIIIGATGTVGSAVRTELLKNTDFELVNVARHISGTDNARESFVSSDAGSASNLTKIFTGADAVFVAISGNLPKVANAVVEAAKAVALRKIIFISSMGIYGEVHGNPDVSAVLRPYREAADIIEASKLDTTIIRPGWFDEGSEDYVISQRNEPFVGHDIAVSAIADLVKKVLTGEVDGHQKSLGIYRPIKNKGLVGNRVDNRSF